MKPKKSELPLLTSLNKMATRINCNTTFLGYITASPMKFGAPLDKYSVIGAHIYKCPMPQKVSTSTYEDFYLEKGWFHLIRFEGSERTFYKRFESRQDALDWFDAIQELDTASHSLLWSSGQ